MAFRQLSSNVCSTIALVLLVAVLGACAMSHEGAVDFRKASLSTQSSCQQEIKEVPPEEDHSPLIRTGLASKFVAAGQARHCTVGGGHRRHRVPLHVRAGSTTSYTGLAYPRLEAGNYVFIREMNRQANTRWGELLQPR